MSASNPLNKVILEFGDGVSFDREISGYLDDLRFRLIGGKDIWVWDEAKREARRPGQDGICRKS
jgi:hypothetical protein